MKLDNIVNISKFQRACVKTSHGSSQEDQPLAKKKRKTGEGIRMETIENVVTLPKKILQKFDNILNIPGLQHIPENIFRLLDQKSLMNCRFVKSSWRNVLERPTFWLKKLELANVPKDDLKCWKTLAINLNDDHLHEIVLVLTKMYQTRIKHPLESVVDLEKGKKFPELVKLILENVDPKSEIDANIGEDYYFTEIKSIDMAAFFRKPESVEKLIEKHGPEVISTENYTTIHCAAFGGNINLLKILVRFVKNPIIADVNGRTPIHVAAEAGHLESVRFLAGFTDTPIAQNNKGETPIHEAASKGHLDVVKYLVGLTDFPNVPDNYGDTPIHFAAIDGQTNAVKLLIGLNAPLPLPVNSRGETPLHYAAYGGHLEIVKFLVGCLDVPNAANNFGSTPAEMAAQNGHDVVAKFLEDYNNIVNSDS